MKRLFLKKIAYTLAEMMFVLAIIGVISAIIIHNTKTGQNQYKKLYAVAFNTLVQTAGNAALNWRPVSGMCGKTGGVYGYYWSKDCWEKYTTLDSNGNSIENNASESIYGYPRQYPGFLYGNGYERQYEEGSIDGKGTDKAFCRALTSQINTVDEQNECQSFISGVRPGYILMFDQSKKKPPTFSKVFCALQEDEDDEGNKIGVCAGEGNIIPSFIASNGQKFYISTVLYANAPYGVPNTKERMAFRLVVVDLNGDSGPNTQLKTDSQLPDIVLFAINSSGKVIPLGWPEFDELYLSASVYYPKFYLDSANKYVENEKYRSGLMNFFNAKMHAWAGDVQQGGVGTTYFGQPVKLSEPYSLSNLLYFWGVNCHHEANGNVIVPVCNPGSKMYPDDIKLYVDNLFGDLVYAFTYTTSKEFVNSSNYVENTFIPTSVEIGTLDKDYGCIVGESPCKVDFADALK